MPNESIEAGRKLVVTVAAVAIAISFLTVTFNVVRDPDRLPQQLVPFGLTLGLCAYLVRGRSWARWISVLLFLIGGIGAVLVSLGLFGKSMGAWAMLTMGVAYLYCTLELSSPSVRAFFGSSRAPAIVQARVPDPAGLTDPPDSRYR